MGTCVLFPELASSSKIGDCLIELIFLLNVAETPLQVGLKLLGQFQVAGGVERPAVVIDGFLVLVQGSVYAG